MAETIKGINVVIGSETTALTAALKDVNTASREIQSELKQVERLLKMDPGNTELLAQKQKLLTDAIAKTGEKLDALKNAQAEVNGQMQKGEISEAQYRAFQREIAKTEQELSRLEAQAIKSNAVLSKEDAVNNLKNIAKAAGAAALALGGALVTAAVQAGQRADDINTLAKVTGLTTEQIQKFQYASDRIDVSLDTLTGSMAKLTKNMASAQGGSEKTSAAFSMLGVSVTDGAGQLRDNNEVFNEVIEALGKMENETQRDALAMQIFGKSAQDLNPLILGGADALKILGEEAEAAGVILSQEALDKANAFNDALDKLKALSVGAFAAIGAGVADSLVPAFERMLQVMQALPEWLEENRWKLEVLGVMFGTVTALVIAFNIQQALLASGLTVWSAAAGAAAGITGALGTAFTFLTGPVGLAILAIGALIAAGVAVCRNWDEIKAALSNAWSAVAEFFTVRIPAAIDQGLAFFAALPGKIIGFLNELPAKIGFALGLALGTIVKFGADTILWAAAEVPKFIAEVIRFYMELPGKIWEWLASALDKVKEWGANLVSWAKTNLPAFISLVTGFFADLPGSLYEIGAQMIKGLWNGIVSLKDWLYDKVMGFIDGLIEGVSSALGISSPSKVFAGIGENVSLGLAQGVNSAAAVVERSLGGLLSAMNVQASVALAGSGGSGATYNSGGNVINISVTDGDDLLRTLARLGVVI